MGHHIVWSENEVTVDGKAISLTNLNKPLGSPASPFTRLDVVEYYLAIGDYVLIHTAHRRLTGVRHPDGLHKPGFFMKTAPKKRPEWVRVVPAPHGEDDGVYICADELATLVWLASSDVVELHVPHTTIDKPETVDGVILDLDPGSGRDLADAARLAIKLRETLLRGRKVRYKTSGKNGLHIYLPSEDPVLVEVAQAEARSIAEQATAAWSELATNETGKARRVGKILIDWQQNARHRTTAAPYTLRGGGGVSTPISEQELHDMTQGIFHVAPRDIPARIATYGDLYLP